MTDKLTVLQETLDYRFRDIKALTTALTHPTYAYEFQQEEIKDNQRLEFLGDSVLGMVVAEHLYAQYPDSAEGELTRRRSLLVNKRYLAERAKKIGLSKYLLLGKGETKMDGAKNMTNLSGALEAMIGAVYVDGGFEQAKKLIMKIVEV